MIFRTFKKEGGKEGKSERGKEDEQKEGKEGKEGRNEREEGKRGMKGMEEMKKRGKWKVGMGVKKGDCFFAIKAKLILICIILSMTKLVYESIISSLHMTSKSANCGLNGGSEGRMGRPNPGRKEYR